MKHTIKLMLALTTAAAVHGVAMAAPDGERLFRVQCKGCHLADGTGPGPSLNGVFGAKIGARPNFAYSPALAGKKDDSWTEANLGAWLAGTDSFAPGTSMPTPQGLLTPADRAAVVQYLKTLK